MRRRTAAPSGVEELPHPPRVTSPSQVPVDRLRLTVLRRIDGLLAGDHAGLFPGHGTERGEARPYVPGDDPRHLDWAVTARTQVPYVRDTISDHELELWVVLDSSASLAFGTARSTKHEIAWSAAGAFALLASDGGNRVGGVRTAPSPTTDRPLIVPARSGSKHVGAVLAALRRPPVDGDEGDMVGSLELVRRSVRRRGMVIVVSDFLGEPTWERSLRALGHRHEVIAIEVTDPREVQLPDVGLVALVDPETGRRRLVDTSNRQTRQAYDELAAERRADVAARLKACGADHLALQTDRDWVLDFVRFVSARKTRLMAAGRAQR